MEITDLQINDWVYDKSFTPSNFPCRIYSIEGRYPRRDKDFNDKPLIDVWVGDGFLSSHIENIEPIPLTEEILEKNGWCYDSELNNWWHEGVEFLIWHDEKIGFYCCNITTITLNEVHRLQHLLRLCGLNELADNFKIE